MHRGKIKKVIRSKGFGFIHATDGRDIFFHQGSLLNLQLNNLNEEQEVEFEVEKSYKGPCAVNVRLIENNNTI